MADIDICKNCKHWDVKNIVKLPVYGPHDELKGKRDFAPCKANAVYIEAVDCLPMMGAESSCRWQEEPAFDPSPDYLAWEHERETQNDDLPVMQDDPANYRRRAHAAA